ncbi:MAG TPA: CoA-binding protein [Candidatus Wallbacteria bacterium]|nr:MAG: hypothetical protein BWY32_01975 [bacterium ADurb.Bin243]HOD41224.1 CoA-binding protein [Candidatus Wallbacteria bacterium]HPG56975.1 CoA-binding protein [Candidatus Wallbacteria bacterium]
MNEELIQSFLSAKVFGLVGASDNPEKYGNIILKNLVSKGYKVLPVNPGKSVIEGLECFSDIASLPEYVKFLNFVIPAPRAKKMMQAVKDKGIEIVWFQPGAYDDDLIGECEKLGIQSIHDGSCIMVCAASGCK